MSERRVGYVTVAFLVSCFALLLPSDIAHAGRAALRPLGIVESIESARILEFDAGERIHLSRDGRKYLVAEGRGDLQRDGVWVSFLTGGTESLEVARPRVATRLFTRALGNTPVTLMNTISWLSDHERIAFVWEDGRGTKQVMALHLSTGKLQSLTRHPEGVEQYAVSPAGDTVLYTATTVRDEANLEALRRGGFAVSADSGLELIRGNLDGWNWVDHIGLFVAHGSKKAPLQIHTPSVNGARYPGLMQISPNGRYALVTLPIDRIPAEWDRYTSRLFKTVLLPSARSKTSSRKLQQLHVVDIETNTVRPLWDAPSTGSEERVVWSKDGTLARIGPTLAPVKGANAAGSDGRAVAEVNVTTGRFRLLSFPHGAEKSGRDRTSKIQIEVREGLNNPAELVAVDASGKEHEVADLNIDLRSRYALGRVELLQWTNSDGVSWSGRLYYPVSYSATRRYPLVIQTHGFSTSAFSLIGDERFPSVFAAQPLATRDIAVLQIGDPDPPTRVKRESRGEAKLYMAGFASAIERLVVDGLIDRRKVGISGFSRTGWHVEYALAHSEVSFAAAIAADNIDSNYLQALLAPEWAPGHAENNGGPPFGEGLASWLEESPAFNVERIRTPLRLQVNSGGLPYVMTHWEMYARLKALELPVELYVIPNIEQGTHNLQNTRQLLASAGGAVDWYDFWLNGSEDPDPAKSNQYMRWHALRTQHLDASGRARPRQLKWTAESRI